MRRGKTLQSKKWLNENIKRKKKKVNHTKKNNFKRMVYKSMRQIRKIKCSNEMELTYDCSFKTENKK